jgi:hypothetical protein
MLPGAEEICGDGAVMDCATAIRCETSRRRSSDGQSTRFVSEGSGVRLPASALPDSSAFVKLVLAERLDGLYTYDERMSLAAREAGLSVQAPS